MNQIFFLLYNKQFEFPVWVGVIATDDNSLDLMAKKCIVAPHYSVHILWPCPSYV